MSLKDFTDRFVPAPKTATAIDELDKVPEIEATLYRTANDTRNNQYRGRNDEAGTVRVRVYIGGDAAEHAGEIITASLDDVTFAEAVEMRDGTKLTKLEFRNTVIDKGVLVMWAPEEADITGVKVIL